MTQINVTELNFDTIKANLKAWMSTREGFTDYDFEASGLSYLLDVLAYNTTYNAVLANFAANEMFLDTAWKRSSVLSHAKALGYHPRSYRAARAKINIVITSLNLDPGKTAPDSFILRRGTAFTAAIDNAYYEFVTIADHTAARSIDGEYYFDNVEIVEGIFNTFAWQVSSQDFNLMYSIPNPRVDLSTVNMQVFPSNTSPIGVPWYHSSSLFDVTETSNVFFTQETDAEKTDIYFGNGIVGAKPAIGEVIKIEYITTNGASGNGAKSFAPSRGLVHNGDAGVAANMKSITLVSKSSEGAESESIDEIKYHASKHCSVQNRAITPYDYVSLIRENFFNIESIKVWGGEDNIPAQYNTVFICIKPSYSEYLTSGEKEQIKNIVSKHAIMNIGVTFTDPDYINIMVDAKIIYSPSKLATGVDLPAVVRNAIIQYSDMNIESFNSQFRYSRFTNIIDDSSAAVISNITNVQMYKKLAVEVGRSISYSLSFLNELNDGVDSIKTSLFVTSLADNWTYIKNVGSTLVMGYDDDEGKFVAIKDAGTIDYKTGTLYLYALNVLSLEGGEFKVYAKPVTNDINSLQNNILRILPSDISIKMTAYNANQMRIQAT